MASDNREEPVVPIADEVEKRLLEENRELRRRLRQLEQSNEKFLSLASTLPAYIAYVDVDTLKYEFVNDAFVTGFGLPREKIVGSHIREIIGEANYEFALPFIRKVREGEAISYENSFRLVSGTRWIKVTYTPVLDASGRVVSIGVLSHDITELKRDQEERQRLQIQVQYAQKLESLGVLAGGVAHDFNNILLAILGNAELALDDLPPDSLARPLVREIEKAALRAGDLTRQMLAFSGQGRFEIRSVDLSEVSAELSRLLGASFPKKTVLETRFAADLPLVRGDVAQLQQLVLNVIVNAAESVHDERGGVVTVTTGAREFSRDYLHTSRLPEKLQAGRYVCLEVSDTGCGMDAATLDRLFDPFFTTKFPGRGLGMAAVLGIVRGHKGAIMVESVVGTGTTLRVLFPALDRQASERQEPGEAPPRTSCVAAKILFVDDEQAVREVGVRMLARLGRETIAASDGLEAIELYAKHVEEIGLVVLDLNMPKMDGEQTLRELRKIRRDVRVILTSGYSESELEARFAGSGVASFLQKPFQLATLDRMISAVLGPQSV